VWLLGRCAACYDNIARLREEEGEAGVFPVRIIMLSVLRSIVSQILCILVLLLMSDARNSPGTQLPSENPHSNF